MQDFRYALRTLCRTPGFSAIAISTLALGIGANTAIFSLVNAVILKPLPFHDPARLVAIWDTYLPQFSQLGVSPSELAAWREQSDLLEDAAWYRYVPKNFNLTAPGREAIEVHAACASDRLFPLLGISASVGRTFNASEEPHSVILSHRLWASRFDSDPAVLGRTLRLSDEEFTAIGVMPPGFAFPEFADLWLTQAQMGDELTNPVRHAAGLVARLRPDIDLREVRTRSAVLSRRLASEHPKTSQGWGMKIARLQDDLTANVRPALLTLLAAVGMVLLIACANVANLLLARATSRSKEMALRAALGSGRWRIVRQLLVESLLLAGAGGGLGLLLGEWSLRTLAPVHVPLDSTVLLFVLGVCVAMATVFGLVPAVDAMRSDPNAVIKSGSLTGKGSGGIRASLVVVELALSVILLVGAGILVKSFARLMHVDPGFDPHRLLTFRLSMLPSRNPADLFQRIDERLRSLPGVESVAAVNTLPLVASRANTSRFNVPGSPMINADALPAAQLRTASPDYFRTMRIPLRAGRMFTERDLGQPVVIINETMARRFWPGRDPVGLKYIIGPWGPNPTWATIIGVVGAVKQFGLDSETSFDEYSPSLAPQVVIVRTSGDPSLLVSPVRTRIHAIDAGVPISDVQTMDQVMSESAHSRRWTMGLLAAYSALALLLSLVGIYGVMSWSTAQRTREIGIRMALGARSGEVLRMVLGQGLRLAAGGLCLGIIGGLVLRRMLSALVFDVSTADPLVYAAVVPLLLGAALLACYGPARRASREDPVAALRCE